MKKTIAFLRSMKLGMILLLILLVLCFLGSMIVQGRDAGEYISRYGEQNAFLIMGTALDHVFSSWYFILVSVLFCLNLVLCSVQRFRATRSWKQSFLKAAERCRLQYPLDADTRALLLGYLSRKRAKKLVGAGGTEVYCRNLAGAWGSFITHISLLLVFLVGAAVLCFADVQDITVRPGETVSLDNGAQIYVESFRMSDEAGSVDYVSDISLTLPGGRTSGIREIRVNYPLTLGQYKIYQQNYRTNGYVNVRNDATGAEDEMLLDDACFLTLDGVNGFYFDGLFTGYEKGADGEPVMTDKKDASTALYSGSIVTKESMEGRFLFPGDVIEVGGMTLTVKTPETVPGLRVKQLSGLLLGLLYLVFALLIFGLWMCFFKVPVCVAVKEEGFSVTGTRTASELLLDLELEGVIPEDQTK